LCTKSTAFTDLAKPSGEWRIGVIRGFRHTGITVRDMEKALVFYQGLLGLAVVSDRVVSDGGLFVGVDDVVTRICLLEIPGSSANIELLEYRGAGGKPASARPVDEGVGHASFWVTDIMTLYARLVEQNVPVITEPIRPPTGRKKFYASDPDGFWIELTEAVP